MVSQLETELGIDLPSTIMFDYPTKTAISRALLSILESSQEGRPRYEDRPLSPVATVRVTVREILASILGDVPSDDSSLMTAGMTSR